VQPCRMTPCVVSDVESSRTSRRGMLLRHAASKGARRRNARSACEQLFGSNSWLQGSNSKLPLVAAKPMEFYACSCAVLAHGFAVQSCGFQGSSWWLCGSNAWLRVS